MKTIDLIYIFIAIMSVIAFFAMGSDKAKAKKRVRRTPEKTLFLLAIFGGAIGGTLGMYSFRHKTKHWYFAVFFPLLAVAQLALCVWLTFTLS